MRRQFTSYVILAALAAVSLVRGAQLLSAQPYLTLSTTRLLRWVPLAATAVALAAVLGVSWLRARRAGERWQPKARSLVVALSVWLGVIGVVSIAQETPYRWSQYVLPYLVAGVVALVIGSLSTIKEVRAVFSVAGLAVAVFVLLDAFGMINAGEVRRPGGILHNRSFSGEYLALALPLAIVWFSRGHRRYLLLLIGLALALTRSRSGWIAGSLGIGVVLVFSTTIERRARAFGAGLVLAGALAASVVPTDLNWKDDSPYLSSLASSFEFDSGSGLLRRYQYAITWHTLSEQDAWLTGIQIGGWQKAIWKEHPRLAANPVPHSDYLRMLIDGGLFTLAGLIAVYVSAMVVGWRRRREDPDALAVVCVMALLGGVAMVGFRLEAVTLSFAVIGILAATRREPATG